MGRGQTEVIAVVILIGIVLVSATVVLAVGSSALTAVQEQSDREHSLNEMQSLSHEIDTAIQSGDTVSLQSVQGGYEVSDGANVTLTVDDEDPIEYNTGELTRNGLVYHGGMILEDGHVLHSPQFDLRGESTTMQIPAIEHTDGDTFDGEIRSLGTETPIDEPAERLVLEIESEYYEQWAGQFAGANAAVTMDDENQTTRVEFDFTDDGIQHSLTLGMSDGSSFDLNDLPETDVYSYNSSGVIERDNAVVTTRTGDGQGNLGGSLSIQGDLFYDGVEPNNQSANLDVSGVIEPTNISTEISTTDLLLDTGNSNYESGDGDLRGGVYYADELTLEEDLTVEGPSMVVVDGDLILEDDVAIEVLGALDVYVHGSVILGDGTEVGTEEPYEAKRVSFFVEDDISLAENADEATFTGLLYGTDSTLEYDSNALTVYGAIVLDDIETGPGGQSHTNLNIRYDERLQGESLYANSRVDLRDRFEDFEGIIYDEDFPDFEDNYDEDVLVRGEADAENVDFENLAVEDDLTVEGGTIDGGELWVDGDAALNEEVNMNNEPDLFVSGDATIDGGTYSNIYVVGDLEMTGNANVHGEIHVLGDFTLDSEPIDGDLYVGGDAQLDSTVQGDEAHILGDVTCDSETIDAEVYIGDESESEGCGDISEETASPPQIPPHFLPTPVLDDLSTIAGNVHYFDIRVAHMEVA